MRRVGQCAECASVARAHALLPPAHMHRLASPAADPDRPPHLPPHAKLVDEHFTTKLCDFNLASLLRKAQQQPDDSGTPTNPRWLPPELLRAEHAVAASDCYSFSLGAGLCCGCSLCERKQTGAAAAVAQTHIRRDVPIGKPPSRPGMLGEQLTLVASIKLPMSLYCSAVGAADVAHALARPHSLPGLPWRLLLLLLMCAMQLMLLHELPLYSCTLHQAGPVASTCLPTCMHLPALPLQIRRCVLDGKRPELPSLDALPGPDRPSPAAFEAYCSLVRWVCA